MTKIAHIHVPHETVSDETVRVIALPCNEGQPVKEGDRLAELETSKAAIEISAPISGYVRYLVALGADVAVGAEIAQMAAAITDFAEEPAPTATASPVLVKPAAAATIPDSARRISAKARALIVQHKLDLALFGEKAMITEADVKAILSGAPATLPRPAPAAAVPTQAPALPPVSIAVRCEPASKRKQMERTILGAGSPPYMLPSIVGVQRKTRGLKAAIAQHPILHGNALAVTIYETSRLLLRYPEMNAFYEGDSVHYYKEVHVGFALDDGRGLVVPCIRNTDKKDLAEIVSESEELMVKYAEDRLANADVVNGTFTISDLSPFNVPFFVPLISGHQSAILGVCSEFVAPEGTGQQTLVLSFDHQVANGRKAACFLNDLNARLAAYEDAFAASVAKAKNDETFCATCGKSPNELKTLKAHLFRTVEAGGKETLVCSICLAGF